MSVNITRINEGFQNLSFVLETRVTNARDMYDIMRKLNTEQETSGEFDTLLANIYNELNQYDLSVDVHPHFFTGREDVIFELSVNITMNKGCKLDNKDLTKEYILGSVLKDIKQHFDFYYSKCNSDIDTVKNYFRGY